MNKTVDETQVFRFLCYQSALPSLHEAIFSVRFLADNFRTTKYHMRKIIKSLVEKGLIELAYEGGQDEDGNVHCYKGYIITRKATETKLYKEEDRKVLDYINEFLRTGGIKNEQTCN